MVVARGLDVALPPDLPVVRRPDDRQARIVLAEDGPDGLSVQLRCVYHRGEGEVEVRAPTRPSLCREGLVRRDLAWEAAERAAFTARVGTDGLVLRGDAAADFLVDHLPALAERWPVFGRDTLTRVRTAGIGRPVVRVSEHEDWFDLDVRFEVAGRAVAAPPVLASWRRGERYHRLDDGALMRLPAAWLERHARVVDTLLAVRRAQQRLGSWHAWMASELLQEAGAVRWVERARALAAPIPEGPPPEGLRATLRPYQQRGVDWLRALRDRGLHGLLADEMGLGKTVQALGVLVEARGDGPSLVVAPTSVLWNWRDEAARFAPELRVVVWHGPGRDPGALAEADLVLTTYALLRRDLATLRAQPWTWLVLDEAQQVKNPGSVGARAARQLRARHRLALTGTPLENDLTELWSVLTFLLPGLLGTRKAFHARFAEASDAALQELHRRTRPFVLRRRKDDVAPELPPLSEVTLRVPLSQGERHLYDAVRNTVREALLGADDAHRSRIVLDGLTRLRQAACHPALLPFPEARRVQRSSKLAVLLERLEEVVLAGSRALVFSQWVGLLDRVADALAERRLPHLRLQGDTRDRAGVVAAFQRDDGPPVLLVSLKAGGTGLNLVAADVVFHLDPWWNPAAEDQATDRAHRIGQRRAVTAYRLVAADTIEERVLALQAGKRRLFERTVGRAAGDGPPTLAELEALIAL
ncbi:MAG: SNF2-related protein [Myxococcota bacterium]